MDDADGGADAKVKRGIPPRGRTQIQDAHAIRRLVLAVGSEKARVIGIPHSICDTRKIRASLASHRSCSFSSP